MLYNDECSRAHQDSGFQTLCIGETSA